MQGLTQDLTCLVYLCGLKRFLVANDMVAHPGCTQLQSVCAQGAAAVVLVPVTARGQLLGGLLALSVVPDTFDYYYCKVRHATRSLGAMCLGGPWVTCAWEGPCDTMACCVGHHHPPLYSWYNKVKGDSKSLPTSS